MSTRAGPRKLQSDLENARGTPMTMKRFSVEFTVTVELEVAEDLIEEVTKPDWQRNFYPLKRPDDVAAHLAYNVTRNHAGLNSLDGFAHFDEDKLKVVDEDWSDGSVATVVKTKSGRKKKSS